MDVRIEVSLLGGHVWDFVCDEEDPLVFGLVSALPGVTADANLPVDGLIQIERRSGDRIYFTRSSLVSVAVSPVAGGPAADARPGGRQSPVTGATARSMMIEGVFQSDASKALVALRPRDIQDHEWPGRIALEDADLDTRVGEDIVRLATTARSTLTPSSEDDATLDVDFFRLEPGGTVEFAVSPSDRIWMCVVVSGDPLSESSFEIAMSGTAGAANEDLPAEKVVVAPNAAYVSRGGQRHVELRATGPWGGEGATVARIVMRATAP